MCVTRALPWWVATTGKLAPADGATTPDSDEAPPCLQECRLHTHAPQREPFPQCEMPDADPQNLTAAPSKSAPIVGVLEHGERVLSTCVPFHAESLGGPFVPVRLRARISIAVSPLSQWENRLCDCLSRDSRCVGASIVSWLLGC